MLRCGGERAAKISVRGREVPCTVKWVGLDGWRTGGRDVLIDKDFFWALGGEGPFTSQLLGAAARAQRTIQLHRRTEFLTKSAAIEASRLRKGLKAPAKAEFGEDTTEAWYLARNECAGECAAPDGPGECLRGDVAEGSFRSL